MTEHPIAFQKFTALSDWCCRIIGMRPYTERLRSGFDWQRLFFIINVANINFWTVGECLFVYMSLRNNVNHMEASLTTSFISVMMIANFKLVNIHVRKKNIVKIMKVLRELFPSSVEEQKQYGVKECLKKYNTIHMPYLGLHIFIVWVYNLIFIITDFVSWLQGKSLQRPFPYFIWLPWEWQDTWFYFFAYAAISWGAFVYFLAQATADGVMYICVTQVIMHFRYLQNRVLNYVPKATATVKDLRFLAFIVERHNTLLDITNQINAAFGLQLFFYIMISTMIVCFGAFEVLNDEKDVAWLLSMYVMSVFTQVFIISLYSHYLIESSEKFTSAIYSHQWYDADIRYKRMLPFIMQRAQSPPMLMATKLVPISLTTVTVFVQTSYKFLALLQTLYTE